MTLFQRLMSIGVSLISMVLTACDYGERGGVTITPYTETNTVYPRPGGEPTQEAVAILSEAAICLQLRQEDYQQQNKVALVQSWACRPETPFQSWVLSDRNEILSSNGHCMSLGEPIDEGFLVTAATCTGADNQKWDIDEQSRTIYNIEAYHLCLDILEENIDGNGNSIALMPCDGTESQQWRPVALKRQYLISAKNPVLKINIEPRPSGPPLAATPVANGWLSAEWSLEPVGPYYRIRSYWIPDQFLHIEYGNLQSGPARYYWRSAQWMLIRQSEGAADTVLLRSVWKTDLYIGLDNNQDLRVGTLSELAENGTLWRVADVNP